MTSKWRLLAGTVFSVIYLTSTAHADPLNVQGTVTGSSFASSTGLGYAPTTPFNATVNAQGNAYGINLGTFTYTAPLLAFAPTTFTATVTISKPSGTNPQQQTANIDATAVFGLGLATINFSNTPLHFDFGSGSFNLTLLDVTVLDLTNPGGGSATLYGNITNAVVSMAEGPPAELLLSLLVGVGYVLKKRMAHAV